MSIIFDTTASETYVWNDTVYTSSGTYMQVFFTEQGCDSIVMLMLTIIHGGHQGIEALSTLAPVKVYPNPTTGRLIINADGLQTVEVFDKAGRLVATFAEVSQLDLSQLPADTYLLRLRLHDGYALSRVILTH